MPPGPAGFPSGSGHECSGYSLKDLNHYYDVAQKEDVYVTRNGRDAIVVSSPAKTRVEIANSLIGCLPPLSDEEMEKIMEERLGGL